MAKLFTFLLIIVNVSLAVTGQLTIKAGMRQVGYITAEKLLPLVTASLKNPLVLLGLGAYTLAAITWIIVLSRVDVSFAYPMLSLGYLLVLIFAVVWLGEAVTMFRMIGTAFIIAGVVFVFHS